MATRITPDTSGECGELGANAARYGAGGDGLLVNATFTAASTWVSSLVMRLIRSIKHLRREASSPLLVGGHGISADEALTYLPDGTRRVEFNLSLCGDGSFVSLPNGLIVGGHFLLKGCQQLTRLPNGLITGGSIVIVECPSLVEVPTDLTANASMFIIDCAALAQLPDGLRVKGDLHIYGCPALTKLPNRLRVDGSFYWSDSPSCMEIPSDLRIDGDLCLMGSTDVSISPRVVGGRIHISSK